MKVFDYVITDENGIHARPAGILVKKAQEFTSDIKVKANGKSANAKRIFSVMGLGVKKGDTITVEAEGEDEDKAAETVLELLKKNF